MNLVVSGRPRRATFFREHYTERLHSLFPLLILSSSTFAATEFDDNVPAESSSKGMGAMFGQQVRRPYSEAPDGFPAFRDDAQGQRRRFSPCRPGRHRSVILKSQFDRRPLPRWLTARCSLDSLGADPDARRSCRKPGSSITSARAQTQLCHDDFGMMQVSAQRVLALAAMAMTRNIVPPADVDGLCAGTNCAIP